MSMARSSASDDHHGRGGFEGFEFLREVTY
jgi:hypothetical protein